MTEYVGAIEKQTLENTYFRRVLFTGQHAQLVVMCLRPGEEIGDEVHPNIDQFFRIEQGEAKFVFDEKAERPARRRCGRGSGRNVPQRSEHVEDGDAEAIYDLLSAEPPGRDRAQDQSRGGGCRIGGTPPKRTGVSVKVARAPDRTKT
jgi:mannose-6-phosphate isomerase-like protein (cupin superfamily)